MIKASLCYFKLFLSLAEVEHETEGTNVPQMEKKTLFITNKQGCNN